MTFQQYLNEYQDFSAPSLSLAIPDRIRLINKQLKAKRDRFCKNAHNVNEVLEAQYAYVVSTLNIRHALWKYDYMTFPRRVGELWESFCKACFYNAESRYIRPFTPPPFDKIRRDLTKKSVPPLVWELVGNVNLKQDSVFYCNRKLHVIDLKSSFNSHEKGNMQRLKTVGVVYKMWKPTAKLYVLVREGKEHSTYLEHLSDQWEVVEGAAAYDCIRKLTRVNLKQWIDENVNFEKHLDGPFYRFLQQKNLEKYLNW